MNGGEDLSKLDWMLILEGAMDVVQSGVTEVTLQQLFYRLVLLQLIPNTQAAYRTLRAMIGEARRKGLFPRLSDNRMTPVCLGAERAGILGQLHDWFDGLGVHIVQLGGNATITCMDQIARETNERPAVLIFASDWDPAEEGMGRVFLECCPEVPDITRVALSYSQISEYGLSENPDRGQDPRAGRLEERRGRLARVELEALPPHVLRDLFAEALSQYFDMSTWERAMRQKESNRGMSSESRGPLL